MAVLHRNSSPFKVILICSQTKCGSFANEFSHGQVFKNIYFIVYNFIQISRFSHRDFFERKYGVH